MSIILCQQILIKLGQQYIQLHPVGFMGETSNIYVILMSLIIEDLVNRHTESEDLFDRHTESS